MAIQLLPGVLTLVASFTTTGTSDVFAPSGKIRNHTYYAIFQSGTSAGVIAVEMAPIETFAGTWLNLGSLTFGSGLVRVNATNGTNPFIRWRVTTPVANGSVQLYYIGNEGIL